MEDLFILGAVMGQFEVKLPAVRKRGRYSNEFKRELVAACRAPGVSVASIALANGINANLLRRWVAQLAREGNTPTGTSPLAALPPMVTAASGHVPTPRKSPDQAGFVRIATERGMAEADARLQIRLQRGDLHLIVTGSSSECAAFVRTLLT
jgi:transposase-like protein